MTKENFRFKFKPEEDYSSVFKMAAYIAGLKEAMRCKISGSFMIEF